MARLIELKQTAPERFLARFDTGEELRTTLAVVTDFHLRSGKELTSPELDALRAAGDARFTMVTSMVSMWVFRIGMSYVLGAWLGMGLFGVWTAMQIDWAVRSLVFGVRFLGHKWEKARVLEG